jgi:DNA-binding MarR family transcriptional regulator
MISAFDTMTSPDPRWPFLRVAVADASATEVSSGLVAQSRKKSQTAALPTDRLAVGQILVRLLQQFRAELFAGAQADARFADIRFPHMHVWGNVGIEGVRLTELARRAQLSLAACSELVGELQTLGYLERRRDPSDGRAKLIFPTKRGRAVLDEAGRSVAELEQRWRALLPAGAFDAACRSFDELLGALEAAPITP